MTPVFKDIDVVGKFMSTKAVNTISRDDVTSKYKHETGIKVLTHFLHSFSKFLNTRFQEVEWATNNISGFHKN